MQRLRNALIACVVAGTLSLVARSYFLNAGRVDLCDKGYVLGDRDRCVPENACVPPYVEALGKPPSGDALITKSGKTCVLMQELVLVKGGKRRIGASDWEAVGARPQEARSVDVRPFVIDNVEMHVDGAPRVGLSFNEALRKCIRRGGRLPTEDEWMLAAMGERDVRYPWGQTGSQCGRAVWGRSSGPCRATLSPEVALDRVGTHPSGKTPSGIYDLGGSVAEWVTGPQGETRVKGGSWRTGLVSELRVWWFLDVAPNAHEDWIGARCVIEITEAP